MKWNPVRRALQVICLSSPVEAEQLPPHSGICSSFHTMAVEQSTAPSAHHCGQENCTCIS